jgi:ABC-type transporter Mla subunit MlaD
MADTGRTDPFADFISFASGPITAVIRQFDQLRRGAEEMLKGFENFNATMANLNETAGRINRLLNDFEEPIRAMLPQITRTVKMADELSVRLATPIDQVVPGLSRLAETLNSPVLRSLPTDLGQFLDIINDVGRRMSPLAQLAEQASMFGFRLPGFSPPAARSAPATAPAPAPAPAARPPAATSAAKKTTTRKRTPAKKKAAPRKR